MTDLLMIQEQIRNWRSKNFPDMTQEQNQIGLTEEVGELSRAILKGVQGIRGTKEEWAEEAYKEIGDVLIALINVANEFGFYIEDALKDRWKTISKRDWNADRVQHGIEKS